MKKKNIIIIITIIAIAFIGFLGVKGKEYYEDRYVGSDYYTQIPADQDMTPEPILDREGVKQAEGKNYTLMAYDKEGNEKKVEFSVMNPDNLLKPNTFLRVSASKQTVVNTTIIDQSEVPEKALEKIQKNR